MAMKKKLYPLNIFKICFIIQITLPFVKYSTAVQVRQFLITSYEIINFTYNIKYLFQATH